MTRLLAAALILPTLALAACNTGNRDAEQAAAAAAHAQNEADRAAAVAAAEAPPSVIMIGDRFGAAWLTFTRTGDIWIADEPLPTGGTELSQISEERNPNGPNRLTLMSHEMVWVFDLDGMHVTVSRPNGTFLDRLPVLRFS